MNDTYKIYKYTNVINEKVYIGQTKNSLKRRSERLGRNYIGCRYFYNAIQKYGWDNFIPEILEDNLSKEEANRLEKYYIKKFDSTNRNIGYNILSGGNNSLMPEESKEIISEKAKERYKDKTKNPMYGKKHSQDSLNKMRNKKVGKSNPMYRKHLSDEAKRKQKETFERNGSTKSHEWTQEERTKKSIQQKELCKIYVNKIVKCVEDNLLFDTVSEAARFYGVSVSTLSSHLHGKQHTCKNKHFVFAG